MKSARSLRTLSIASAIQVPVGRSFGCLREFSPDTDSGHAAVDGQECAGGR